MLIAQETALMDIFREQAAARKRELRFYEDSEQSLERQTLRERREEEQRRDIERLEAATSAEIGFFRDRLDRYDTAVVEALMENEEAPQRARHAREDIETKAYRLPDGRMVFKMNDGKHVVDETGRLVPPSVIQPDSMPNNAPRWEAFKTATSEEMRPIKEREELHDYQQKLDHARDTIDKSGVTKKELDALGDDLEKSMPGTVRAKIDPPSRDLTAPAPGVAPQLAPAPSVERRRPDAFASGPR